MSSCYETVLFHFQIRSAGSELLATENYTLLLLCQIIQDMFTELHGLFKFMINLFTSFKVNNIMCSTIVFYLYPSSTAILGQRCDGVDQISAQCRPHVQFCTMSQHRAGIGVLPFCHQPSICRISCKHRPEGTSAGYSPDVAHASALYRLDIAYVPALYRLSRQYWLAH